MKIARPIPHAVLAGVLSLASTAALAATDARFVRIELPKSGPPLTLAEVEVMSGGKNVAPGGTATQSSEASGGVPSRAIDGNKAASYGDGGQTHTREGTRKPAWWQLDLGKPVPVESIGIWNRGDGLGSRLEGFAVKLLDADNKVVFEKKSIKAPMEVVQINVNKKGKLSYLTRDGKKGGTADLGGLGVELVDVPADLRDPAPFAFGKGDTVAIVGNGLADRMQHEGWTETLLQAANRDKQITFRNLSITGDRVNKFPRSKGFTSQEVYLQHVEADVIFMMFGYNESFNMSPADYAKELEKLITNYRGVQPNGKTFPRTVVFSPIAHENLPGSTLPNGKKNNKRLAAITAATQAVAEKVGVTFVDLFSPTLSLYAASEEPLTLNGVHLNAEGYRQVGEVIAQALTGKPAKANKKHEPLREAVLEKNLHWHHRYRATDGNDVWGGRSTLSFVDGQTNREVLEHELSMLDVMTANRDPKVWARANGKDHVVSDGNVPAPVPVISNVGGGSRSSNAEKEGSDHYVSGEEGIGMMTVPEGYKVNLFADEKRFPEMVNPVQMLVDNKGRLWVAAWQTYPKWEPLKEMDDRLLILPDEDGDGVADKAITFAKVHCPLGFEFWNGGVIVTTQPDITFLKDTDGDDVADVRIVLFQGIGSSDTHHSANNLIYGPDGGIYWQSGIFLQNNFEHPWGESLITGSSAMFRFDPRRYTIAIHAGNSPNPHGTSFDRWGYHFANDGTGGRAYQVRPDGNGFKMHELLKKQVRPVPANEVISSTNFPDEVQQNFLIANTIGFLGLKHYDLARDPETGHVWGEPAVEMLVSSDKNFRPTDAIFGSDGGLYIADWHNVIIGHMQHNIRDPKRDHAHGRVYRMVYEDRPLQKPVKIAGASIPELLSNLTHPTDGVRHRTRIELSGRDSAEVIAATKEWLKGFDPKKQEDALAFLEGLWLHQQHAIRDEALLALVLESPEPHARHAAATVKHHWTVADPATGGGTVLPIEDEKPEPVVVPGHLAKNQHEAYKLGAEVFLREGHCSTCHQPDGQGLENIYPPLVGSPWVTGSEERLAKITLHGVWGPMEVLGKTYDPSKGVPPMTAFHALLNDKEIAAVLTYVRNSWGNQADPVAPATIKSVRETNKDRSIFWKPEELLEAHPMEK